MKRLVTAAVGAAALLGVYVSSASAATCTGTATATNATYIQFYAATDVCTISDSFSNISPWMHIAFVPTSPEQDDLFQGSLVVGTEVVPDSFVVGGITGTGFSLSV